MLRDYEDIRSRITDPILWWDDNGMPRYCEFRPIPTRIEVREGKNLGYGPNHNGYDKTCVKEGLNQVAISTMAGTGRGEIGVLCGSLHLQPEPKK